MKYLRTVLGMALFAGLTMTRPATAGPTVSTTIPPAKQSSVHWFSPARTTGAENDLRPVEGLSRRAWTTTVGWRPGTSAFPDDKTYSSRMCLFWVGHEPWQHVTHSVAEQ